MASEIKLLYMVKNKNKKKGKNFFNYCLEKLINLKILVEFSVLFILLFVVSFYYSLNIFLSLKVQLHLQAVRGWATS